MGGYPNSEGRRNLVNIRSLHEFVIARAVHMWEMAGAVTNVSKFCNTLPTFDCAVGDQAQNAFQSEFSVCWHYQPGTATID